MLNWNDVRYLVGLGQHGSTIAAAKALGVNQSTVMRRLAAIEAALGRELVERAASGYSLTPFGASLLPAARGVEAAVAQLQLQARQAKDEASGILRVTCPDPIIPRLMPLIERFSREHPDHPVELVSSDGYLDLGKGDADVAFRSGDTDADLVGFAVAVSTWAVYASRDYIARHGQPQSIDDLVNHQLLTFGDKMAGHRVSQWYQTVAPQGRFVGRSQNVLALIQAVRSGVGVAPLPANIADADPQLVQVIGPVRALERTWRVLTHRSLRRSARVQAFFKFIDAERESLRQILG